MSYRDDRDALDRRVQNLEEDLRVAKEELADKADDDGRAKRIAAIDAHMAEARRDLEKMGQELNELRGAPKPPPKSSRLALFMVAGVLIMGAGAFWVTRAHVSTVARPISVVPSNTPDAFGTPPIKPPVTATPKPPSAPVDERTTTAHWQGKVTSSKGSTLIVGAPCTANAVLRTTGTQVRVHAVDVTCGDKPVYRSIDKLEGTSSTRFGSEEALEPSTASPRYFLFYSDLGTRSGERSQVSVNTSAGTGAAWIDDMPAWRVEFSLDKWSQPSDGPILIDRDKSAIRRNATVESLDGVGSPATLHAKCALVAYPFLDKTDECIVRVSCGSTFLYGNPNQGVAPCTLEDGAVASVSDTKPSSVGGDPMLELDVGAGTVVVSDGPDNHRWAAHLKLTDPSP